MDDDQQFCLRWNNHQSTLISVFDTLLENQTLVDCTLAAEGKFLKAHKVVLSACSPYFATLLQEQYDKHPIFILKDVKFQELRAMMDYMYRGEVNISQDQLAALLKAAESLQIKGLSDNRSTGNINPAPKLDGAHQQHRNLNVGANVGIKIGGGYTLEQTKRTRLGPNALDVQEMSGSREGSSSPSRRRKKVRRRSIEASLADIQHDNSNSSLQQQSNVVISAPGISNVNPISAAASVLAAAQLPSGATPGTVVGTSQTVASSSSSAAAAAAAAVAAANIAPGLVAAATQQMLTNVTKKTESVKGASASSEAMNTEDLATGVSVDEQEQQQTASKVDKHNHKYKATSGKDTSDIVEPKSEYDDDGNEGTVEDLTLDEEDMGIDDLDQNAGTSHVGEGSSQGYAPWQHERSQDDLLMTQQDAQQRDPQDLSRKENCAPLNQILQANPRISLIQHAQQHKRSQSVGADVENKTTNTRKKLSMSEMSDMLLEFYKANVSQKLPKPDEADSNPIPTLATAKNSQSDEMMHDAASISANNNNSIFTKTNDKSKSSFHRQNNKIFARPNEAAAITIPSSLTMTAIPTSVVVPTHTAQVDVKPVINPTTGLIVSNSINAAPISVIKPVLASALMEGNTSAAQLPATKLLENFLIRTQREHRLSDECDDTNSDANDGDDEDDSRYNGFEDIHLMEANVTTKTNVSNLATVDYLSDESQKFMIAQAQAQALRQLEYTLGDYSASSSIRNMTTTNRNESQNESANTDAVYECRHCGKKYRWKSTLRRHENVECGGKEPSHQCPYCAYKSKQRGNLGVHVRKHHSNLPQLVSKRRSKYSHKLENSDVTCVSSANVSDDSSNKMIIDFSK